MLLLQIVAYNSSRGLRKYKAGYTATLVTCGWSGAVLEPYAQKAHNAKKVNSRKSVRWSAVPVAPVGMCGCVTVRGAAALNLKGPMTFAVFSFFVFYNMFSFAKDAP